MEIFALVLGAIEPVMTEFAVGMKLSEENHSDDDTGDDGGGQACMG